MNNSDVSFSLCLFFFFYYKQFIFIQHMSIKIDTDVLLTNKTDHFIIALLLRHLEGIMFFRGKKNLNIKSLCNSEISHKEKYIKRTIKLQKIHKQVKDFCPSFLQ